jgi:chemotaxis protein methyltransferase CheR
MVRFSQLNLVEGTYPSFVTNTNDMDVIFCRNVFIYFSPDRIYTAVGNFHRALVDGGWFIVSPSETAYLPSSLFAPHSFPGTIVHQKQSAFPGLRLSTLEDTVSSPFPLSRSPSLLFPDESPVARPLGEQTISPPPKASPVPIVSKEPPEQPRAPTNAAESAHYREAEILYKEGHYAAVCDKLRTFLFSHNAQSAPVNPQTVALLVRSYANQGAWNDAVASCQKATELDPLNPRLHYLLATLLLEQAREDEANASLKRTLYLDPDFAIAHFALANLAQRQRRFKHAQRHLQNTQYALRHYRPDDLVPEAEGLTVKGLHELITHLLRRT